MRCSSDGYRRGLQSKVGERTVIDQWNQRIIRDSPGQYVIRTLTIGNDRPPFVGHGESRKSPQMFAGRGMNDRAVHKPCRPYLKALSGRVTPQPGNVRTGG